MFSMAARIDETARQRVLDMYRVVDSLPEAAYNDIVSLASILCATPIAVVSLVDREKQWFKASRGLEASETSRDVAFCSHAIEEPDMLMEVPDATRDARFEANPLVTGDLGIRFYAGMPLVTDDGAAIGTVCVIDRTPRELDDTQRAGLRALARLTMTLLDARLHEKELERSVLLHEAAQTDSAIPAVGAGYTVAIYQIQEFAGHVQRLGERMLERQLHELDQRLHAALPPGDSINRTSQSADFIAVLHGDDTSATQRRLREQFAAFTTQSGIAIVDGSAASKEPTERIEFVFIRADEALSRAKDDAMQAA
jgi:GAF domain-containing protein